MRRVGLGWRPELAAAIFANIDRIDVVEVIADDWFEASDRDLRSLRLLGATTPLILHGTSLGLASTHPVDARRLERTARLIDKVQPLMWSEHLAFVRAGGIEIGHLAAPPRTSETIEGLAANVERALRITGIAPALENVATLIDPPLSTMSESEFVRGAIRTCGVPLLLDLHNLHANATNFGFSAQEFISAISDLPVAYVHLAGGRRVKGNRILDDHLHAVPDEVFELLTLLDAGTMVVIERDGSYPEFSELLGEMDRARGERAARPQSPGVSSGDQNRYTGETPAHCGRDARSPIEKTLATLYTDAKARENFLLAPAFPIDREGLELAAESFARKRSRLTSNTSRTSRDTADTGPSRSSAS